MLNLYMIYKENIMITEDIEAISIEKKNIGDDYEIIRKNMG